jgi:uncharacterized protein (TIGR02099 family)
MPQSFAPSLPPLPSHRLRLLAWAARWLLTLLVAVWLALAAGWAFLHGWIVPRIGEFRPQLETLASRALGLPVRIGELSAQSEGLVPSFELRDVRLLDASGRAVLRLPSVRAALSPASLLNRGFEQLIIERPELDLRRTADGRLFLAGLELSGDAASNPALADWFFSQTELAFRGGTVHWSDELRGTPTLTLTDVDWVMRNPGKRHQMRLDATPPPEWGARMSLRSLLRQPLLSGGASQWRQWSGQIYGEFSQIDLAQAQPYADLKRLGVKLMSGQGALRAWADVHNGQLIGGTADVALTNVKAQMGQGLQPLQLVSVAGRLGGHELTNGYDLRTEGLSLVTDDQLVWPGGNVALQHLGAEGRQPERTELKADRLDLGALAQMAHRLPLPADTHRWLDSLAPRGLVERLEAGWQGPLARPVMLSARGRVSALSLSAGEAVPSASGVARPGRPGLHGASVDFKLTHEGGQAQLSLNDGWLDFPGVFEDPRVPMNQLSADLQWKHSGSSVALTLRQVSFANADAQGQFQARWHTSDVGQPNPTAGRDPRFPGVLDLQGKLSRGDASQVQRYLPLVLPDTARRYVRAAVVSGQLSDINFKVKGPLQSMPFNDPKQGDFQISAKLKNGLYAYVPGYLEPAGSKPWPALGSLDADLMFNRSSLQISNARARVADLPGLLLTKGSAQLADLTQNTTVDVNAELKGPLTQALALVNSSPVAEMTRQALARTSASGIADYTLKLSLPLADLKRSSVQGSVSLPGNDVQFSPGTPLLVRLRGVVNFSDSGFSVAGAQARLLGGELRFDGGSRPPARRNDAAEPEVSFRGQGTFDAEALQQVPELGALAGLTRRASGSTSYSTVLGFRQEHMELSVASSLEGLALDLPAPLTKSAATSLPLRFERSLVRESLGSGKKPQDQLSLSLGAGAGLPRGAALMYVRDISGPQAQVLRGSLAIGLETGEAASGSESGVRANLNLGSVDLDAWDKALGTESPTNPGQGEQRSALAAYLPTVVALRARELKLQNHTLSQVVAGGSRDGQNWRANIDANELNGYAEFRPAVAGATGNAGRLYARLSRLSLGTGTASEVEALLDSQPVSIPALDIMVEDLDLRGKKLGRVEVEAINRSGPVLAREGGLREWRLNRLQLSVPEATFSATGKWAAPPASGPSGGGPEKRYTAMDFHLDIADSGALLKRFGMDGVVSRGKGRLEGQVGWTGSPLALHYPSLNGQFKVNIESGQFLKADPGVAKLLGVLSLQALPRRLALDFRDVFSDGFAFDLVRGDVSIHQGVAATNNLQMKGVNAAVLMEGQADIARETQDVKVVVVPDINAGTASLIASAINPVVGLGTFLAQIFLRRPLSEAATQEFHLSGTWSDPRVRRVERGAGKTVDNAVDKAADKADDKAPAPAISKP